MVQVLDVSLQREFSERHSERQESGFLRRETCSTDTVWAITEGESFSKCGVVRFYGLGDFIG